MRNRRRINLCFHGIGRPARDLPPGEGDYWVDTDLYLSVLDLVRDRGDVSLSFDDGNASDVTIGLPALTERGLRAAFYPVAGRLDQPGSVSRADLQELVGAGMEVGLHGMWHRPWRGLSEAELTEELVAARGIVAEASGREVTTAACPLGRYDRQVINRLRRLDFARVYTSDRTSADPGAWLQARFSLRRSDTVASVQAMLQSVDGRADRVRRLRAAIKRWR